MHSEVHPEPQRHGIRVHEIDFDVGVPQAIEQSSFEIEEITLTGEHQVTIEKELVPDIVVTAERRTVCE